ncbi:MAG: DUF3137 domain-containing protein [Bacteroidia bacterium]
MKRFRDVEELYHKELKQALQGLEKARENVLTIYFFAYGVAVLSALVGFVVIFDTDIFDDFTTGAIVFSIPSILMFSYASKEKKKYAGAFKEKVVKKLVHLLDETWEYEAQGKINERIFKKSKIFRRAYDIYLGDDLIRGAVGKTKFSLCDLYLMKRHETEDGNNDVKVFSGLFAAIDFNKHLKGETFVYPDRAEKTFGKFAQKLQKNSRGDLVKLENNEFEKRFKVFSTDQVEARYILTPALMERLVEISKKLGDSISLSFINSHVYILAPFKNGLFEPNVHTSGVSIDDVYTLWSQLNIINLIVDEMDLNTRIWTKE